MSLWLVFLTGLTTGGLSCIAMQGGLLTSVIANQKDQEYDDSLKNKQKKNNFVLASFDKLDWMPVGMFLLTKLISHTVLGILLGLLGAAITLSLELRLAFQVFTALFMFATAMNLLDVHPFFRYVAFQPPKFLQRLIRNSSKSKALFAPALLGALTIFVPCGVTQAMEVLAINSSNPVTGALIMFFFVLGTSPLFAILGAATAKLSEGWYKKFTKIVAISLVLMAVYSLNAVLLVINSPITINKIVSPITYFFSEERFSASTNSVITNGVQEVTINISNNGYSPNYIKVKKNIPVKLTLISKDTYTCALSFVFKEFGIKTFLEATDTQTFQFTPTKSGKFNFTCSMGMYTGTMEVL
jgi:sulfite exporter TauE/SafE